MPSYRRWVLSAAIAAFLLLALPAFAAPSCPALFVAGQRPALLNPAIGQRTTFLCNDAYAVLASGVTHDPVWTAEHLTAASIAGAMRTARVDAFHAEARQPAADRAGLEDYRMAGFDRGHMAPAGDMPNSHAQQESFSLANMVPQTPELNRGPWERIEATVRDIAVRDGEVFVVTGPAFGSGRVAAIGAHGVLVPSATWKAVYSPRRGTTAYWCENTASPACRVISLVDLTAVTGVDPFPMLGPEMKRTPMPATPPR